MSSKKNAAVTMDASRPALVPKLRFPEFEGEWERDKLGAVATLHKGKGVSKADISLTGQVPCIRYGELYTIYGEVIALVHSRTDVPRGDLFLSKSNDVIIPASGETKLDIAKAACVLRDGVALGGDLNVIRTSHNGTFFSYYLNGPKRYDIAKVAQGDSVVHLYPSQLEKLVVAFPSGPEQQRIASCLSSLDDLITAQSRKVDALKTHKKGLMQQLFPREGETQPRLRFPEFQNAGEWVGSPLSKFILSLDAGVSVNSGDRPANKTEFGVLKTSAVTNGVFEPEENKVVFAEDEQSRLKEPVCGGTIIISRMNTPALVGANAYVESSHENLFLPDRLWAAKPRERVSMRFLAFILGSDKGRAALSKLAKGSSGSMKNITKPEVLAFSVMAPSQAEQQRIADCLSSLDEQITNESNKLETYKTHKKGLMQGLFPKVEELAS